jgi:hypothetical protein
MEFTELQTIYNEMDADGRKEILTAASKLLEVQKTLENTPTRNVFKKTVLGRILQNLRSINIFGYLATGILLIISIFILWVTLLNPALLVAGISPLVMVRIIVTALAGLFFLGSGLIDFIQQKIKAPWRLLIIAAGLACAEPGIFTDLIGIILIALIASIHIIQWKKEKTAVFT